MLIITQAKALAIDAISRTRTDGGLGVSCDGTDYKCADVRSNTAYSAYWSILEDAVVEVFSLTTIDFLRRFTVHERCAVRALAMKDPVVEDFIHLLNVAGSIHLDAKETVAGIDYLVAAKILTEERAAEILSATKG